jgi:hypothetical protein
MEADSLWTVRFTMDCQIRGIEGRFSVLRLVFTLTRFCFRSVPTCLITEEGRKMELDDVKAAIKNLKVEERRKVALYILELEKEHIQTTIGPQIAEDLEAFSGVIQDAVEKIKKHLREKRQ